MRSRERLIEVLNSVNGWPVIPSIPGYCVDNIKFLLSNPEENEIQPWIAGDVLLALNNWHDNWSPHIRELLSEGLQILAAEKLVGGCRND